MSLFTRSVFALAATVLNSHAAIVISSVLNTPSGSNFIWTYTFSIQSDQSMRVSCSGVCALPNDYAILYDFPGYVPGTATIANAFGGRTFQLAEQDTGVNPPFQGPPDNPALPNFIIRLTAGGDIVPGGSAIAAFDLILTSTLGPDPTSPNQLSFGGQALTKATNLTAGNSGQILGPGSSPPGGTTTGGEIPEPATTALLGSGLALIALSKLRR